MKTKNLLALAFSCTLSLAGCNSQPSFEEVEIPEEEFYPVQFSIQMEKEIIAFPTTRSIPENAIPEPNTSKTETSEAELKDLCTQIEYIVFEKKEEIPTLIKHRQFIFDETDLDAEFGIVYDSLPKGNYLLYFVAHKSEAVRLSGTILSFDKVSDTFYKALPVEVGVAEEVNQDITLNRIVGRIEFMATDPVTNQLKQFDMEIKNAANQLSLTDNTGITNPSSYTLTHTFGPDETGNGDTIHGFYTFLPSGGDKISVRLSAIGQASETLRERHITDITPAINKIIRYKGRLYSRSESDDTFQVSIFNDGKWDALEDVDLPD